MARFATEDLVGRIGARDLSDNLVFTIENLGSAVFQVDDGFMSPLLTIKQSDHVRTTERYSWITPVGTPSSYGPGLVYYAGFTIYFFSDNQSSGWGRAVSTDSGRTWAITRVGTDYSFRTTVINKNGVLYLSCYRAGTSTMVLLVSLDLGVTWAETAANPADAVSQYDEMPCLCQNGMLVAAGYGNLVYSVDDASSWQVVSLPGLPVNFLGLDTIGSRWVVFYASTDQSIWYSDDQGVNWYEASIDPAFVQLVWEGNIRVRLFTRNGVTAFIKGGTTGMLAGVSTDGGLTWGAPRYMAAYNTSARQSPVLTTTGHLIAPVVKANSYPITVDGFSRTTLPIDEAFFLEFVPLQVDPTTSLIRAVHYVVATATELVAIGHNQTGDINTGMAFWSDDLIGANWLNLSDPLTQLLPHTGFDLRSDYIKLIAPSDGTLYLTLSGDANGNTRLETAGDIQLSLPTANFDIKQGTHSYLHDRIVNLTSPAPSQKVVADKVVAGPSGQFIALVEGNASPIQGRMWTSTSTDYGVSWGPPVEVLATGYQFANAWPMLFRYVAGTGLLIVLNDLNTLVSNDLGTSWTYTSQSGGGYVNYCEADSGNGNLVAVQNSYPCNLYLSEDLGANWTNIASLASHGSDQVSGVLSISGRILVLMRRIASSSSTVLWSDDSWNSFTEVTVHSMGYYDKASMFGFAGSNLYVLVENTENADLPTLVYVSTDNGASFTTGTPIPAGYRLISSPSPCWDGARLLVPMRTARAGSRQDYAANLVTGDVFPIITQTLETDLHSFAVIGDRVVATGHDASRLQPIAAYSADSGVTWQTLTPALSLAPEGGVLDLAISRMHFVNEGDVELLRVDITPQTMTLVGDTSDKSGSLVPISGGGLAVRGPNGDLNFTSDDSNNYHGIELVQTNAAGGGVGIVMQQVSGSSFHLSANSQEAQLTLYGDNSGNTLAISSNVGGYARYYSNQPHEISSGNWYPLRITTQGDAQSYGYFEFQFDVYPYLYVGGGSANNSKGASLQLAGYPADATDPSVNSSICLTGYGWAGAVSHIQRLTIQNIPPTDSTSGYWKFDSQNSRDQDNKLKFVFGEASPVDIEPLYLNLEGPVSTALLPTQNSTMLRFKAHWWNEASGPADAFYDAGIQYQITEVDPVVSKLSFQIDGDELASLDQQGTFDAARFISHLGAPTYNVVVAIDAAAGCVHNITATDGVAFTISNPTNALTGQVIFIKVKNSSGGALGTVTWDTLYKMSAWTSPADGFSRAVEFYFDGTNWVQLTASGVDIPN
jgi:hypothetical protein